MLGKPLPDRTTIVMYKYLTYTRKKEKYKGFLEEGTYMDYNAAIIQKKVKKLFTTD